MAPSAADDDAICTAQSPTGSFLIDGALSSATTGGVATLGSVSAIAITATADHSNHTITISGTDYDGRVLTETITGPTTTATITTVKSYRTVTAVSITGTASTAIKVGVNGTGISRALPMDIHQNAFSVGLGLAISGTANVTVQHTFDDPFASGFNQYATAGVTWVDHSSLASKTASTDGNYAFPCRAIRLKVNSSASGTAALTIIQSGTSSA
jgi:hypothetical protein